MANEREAKVTIEDILLLDEGYSVIGRPAAFVGEPVAQVARVVAVEGYLVVWPVGERPQPIDKEGCLRRLCVEQRSTAAIWVENERIGEAEGSLLGEANGAHAAMALAAAKASMSWDESGTFSIRLGRERFVVRVTNEAGQWKATCSAPAA